MKNDSNTVRTQSVCRVVDYDSHGDNNKNVTLCEILTR